MPAGAGASDWKERTSLLIGQDGVARLARATVAVIGAGGVGGFAAEMIARAGVGRMIIMDSDTVSVTNKNRQLLALDSTIGRPKCDVLAERLRDINPEIGLRVCGQYLEADGVGEIFDGEKLSELVAPLNLGWKDRTRKETAVMADKMPTVLPFTK